MAKVVVFAEGFVIRLMDRLITDGSTSYTYTREPGELINHVFRARTPSYAAVN